MQDADIANFFPGNGAPRLQGDGTLPTNFIQLVTADGYSRYKALHGEVGQALRQAVPVHRVVRAFAPEYHQHRRSGTGRRRAGEPQQCGELRARDNWTARSGSR